ncbi:small subunit ribosomal protein S10e [Nematocida homosporus]|uniref:small subunit ribosomal protein S10e n=1 Tax=Nematocida homosporus TaxID=1912981 RepID=UPI00221FDAC7|nr:small subunit ribosomal protein S10e [Nematocida homosporus]KAI5187398.1 small subunit ribosomal protein S10e [Nematocida homosporus]
MIIPTKEIKKVHEFIFRNGCIVVEDKPTFDFHPLIDVTNHKVMKIVKSMNSKGLFDRQFIWKHAYYTLNDTGVEWLRKKLYLGIDEYPATHTPVPAAEKEVVAEAGAPHFN